MSVALSDVRTGRKRRRLALQNIRAGMTDLAGFIGDLTTEASVSVKAAPYGDLGPVCGCGRRQRQPVDICRRRWLGSGLGARGDRP